MVILTGLAVLLGFVRPSYLVLFNNIAELTDLNSMYKTQ